MNNPGTPIAWPLRAWLVVEVLFGLASILTVAVSPENTGTNFAWEIQPVVMAAVLGAYYFAAGALFLVTVFARRWEMIRVMILPAVLFTAAELIATLLHWSSFSVGTAPFTAWLLSYLLPPPIFIAFYLWHERRARRTAGAAPAEPLTPDVRQALIHWGGLLAILSRFFFVFPQVLIGIAPWRMTPLTVRVFVSWSLAVAAMLLSMARENDRTRVLLGTPLIISILPAVTFQIVRYASQVNFANTAFFVFYGIMFVAFAIGVHLARGDWGQAFR